jgi:hypothetical protein
VRPNACGGKLLDDMFRLREDGLGMNKKGSNEIDNIISTHPLINVMSSPVPRYRLYLNTHIQHVPYGDLRRKTCSLAGCLTTARVDVLKG